MRGHSNITIRKFGSSSVRLVPRLGIIGYKMPRIREERLVLYEGDVLVLYTDGVKEHFELEHYPEILVDDAGTIAALIIENFGKESDDALCIALRCRA